ncbi:MAG: hypothetical protein HKN54_12930 [Flavobacteriaceae bacterium]|nr:hypothetical protein [Flavobacteriaceae bacterium]
MKNFKLHFASLTRIADLQEKAFDIQSLDRKDWATADFVVCKVMKCGMSPLALELPDGRMRRLREGLMVVGALGIRHATLEATGSWEKTAEDGIMHMLSPGGLYGKLTSKSIYASDLPELKYEGHIMRNGRKLSMYDYKKTADFKPLEIPVVLFVGTSMSAGKTTSACIATEIFKRSGYKVVAAKLTGAGCYKDILAASDSGADAIYDFVDVGLPSSICDRNRFKDEVLQMKNLIAAVDADVAIIEIGASPLEPYNGDLAIEAIRQNIKCTILSASDPYAVLGLMRAFEIKPDVVTGISTNTIAGAELVENLCGVKALNLIDPKTTPELVSILSDSVGMDLI